MEKQRQIFSTRAFNKRRTNPEEILLDFGGCFSYAAASELKPKEISKMHASSSVFFSQYGRKHNEIVTDWDTCTSSSNELGIEK